VMLAWGQAEFQGGRDVGNLSYTYPYMGWSPEPPHGPGPDDEDTLQVPRSQHQSWHPEGSRHRMAALFLPPRLCSPPFHALFVN
jgi:hypothetical protein